MSALNVQRIEKDLERFPVVVEGESKRIRRVSDSVVAVELKPTLFSYSANRSGEAPGSDRLRLRISEILWDVLREGGIDHTVLNVGERIYLSKFVIPPPIEVIVKAAHVGTPKHVYKQMERFITRSGSVISPGMRHAPYVRFDWRNPLPERDECMPTALANQFIDTGAAEATALAAFNILHRFLNSCGIAMLDICFFITEDGRQVFGEISPDCMRAKYLEEDLDKDAWRTGKDWPTVISRWTKMLELLRAAHTPKSESPVYLSS